MSASYPSSVKSFTPVVNGNTVAAGFWNENYDETTAVEDALLNGLAHPLRFAAAPTLTIASGAVTVAKGYNAIDTEAAAASDDLDTITAGANVGEGSVIILRAANVARVVTLKDGSGNLLLQGDYALSATDRTIALINDGTNWLEIARSYISVPTPVTPAMTLLYANSGTNTSGGAATIDSIAISGLTVKDSLRVVVRMSALTQSITGTPTLHHVTDNNSLLPILAAGTTTIAAGEFAALEATIAPDQSASTAVVSQGTTCVSSTAGSGIAGAVVFQRASAVTTAWTGSWTLGLRHGGVTVGGTCRYSWQVFKVAGQ